MTLMMHQKRLLQYHLRLRHAQQHCQQLLQPPHAPAAVGLRLSCRQQLQQQQQQQHLALSLHSAWRQSRLQQNVLMSRPRQG
jgi:hypothetical protein